MVGACYLLMTARHIAGWGVDLAVLPSESVPGLDVRSGLRSPVGM